ALPTALAAPADRARPAWRLWVAVVAPAAALLFLGLMVLWLVQAGSGPKGPSPAKGPPPGDEEKARPKPTPPGVIEPAEAARYVNQECVVEMRVRQAGVSKNQKLWFLNSADDFRDENNFAVVIRNLAPFRKADIPDPTMHYQGKLIRARGTVT